RLEVKAKVEDSAAVFSAAKEASASVAAEEAATIAHVSTRITHVAAVAHIATSIAHVTAGISNFTSCCCLTGVTNAGHAHEHCIEHHGIAHHPHTRCHGICPPRACVPTSWNWAAGHRATGVVVRGFFGGVWRSSQRLTVFTFDGALFRHLASRTLAF